MDSQQLTSSPVAPDEISLRDIYLIIRQGFWLILLVSLLLALLGFFYASLGPPTYESESTTSVTPSPISVQNTRGVSLSPRTSIPYQSYERLALSGVVLEAVLKRFPDLNLSLREFERSLSLEQILGPNDRNPQSAQIIPLIVGHTVAYHNPEQSAALTQAWSEETLRVVKQTMSDNLTSVSDVTLEQRSQLRQAMDQAEGNLREFRKENNLEYLDILFEQLNTRVAEQQLEGNDLERKISVANERQQRIAQQLEAERGKVTSFNPSSDEFLAGLTLAEAKATIEAQFNLAEEDFNKAQTALDSFEQDGALTIIRTSIENYQHDSAELPFALVETDNELAELRSQRTVLEEDLRRASAQVSSSDSLSDSFLAGLSLQEGRDFLAKQLELSQNTFTRATQSLNSFDEDHNLKVMADKISQYEDDVAQIPFSLRENQAALAEARARRQLLKQQLEQLQQSLLTIDPSASASFVGISIAEAKALVQSQLEAAQQQRTQSQDALATFDEVHNLELVQQEIARYEQQLAEIPFTLQELRNQLERQQAQQTLLEQQLLQEANKVTSSNPLSDSFLAGLTFPEGSAFLAKQLELAQHNVTEARQALDSFDASHDLTQMEAERATLSEQASTLPFRLDDLALQIGVQENIWALLEQQLHQAQQRSPNTNAASDAALAGLSLLEAQQSIAQQLSSAEESQTASATALDDFDSAHNIALLQAQRDNLRSRLISKQSRSQEIQGEISLLASRLSHLENQLAQQPQLLQLRDAVVSNDILTALNRNESIETLFDHALLSETPNPVYSGLLSDVLTAELQLKNLRAEQAILQEELAARNPEFTRLAQEIITLRRQRDGLLVQAEQDAQRYASLSARDKQLRATLLDTRGSERVLAAGDAVTTNLEARQRAVQTELEQLRSQRRGLEQRLQQAQAQLPALRQEVSNLKAQREVLTQRWQAHRTVWHNVQARVDTFAYNGLDPRENRQLRDTTPEVLALQAHLREGARTLLSLQGRYDDLNAQRVQAEEKVPALRQTQLEWQQSRATLLAEATIADTLWNNLLIRSNQLGSLSLDARGEERILRESNLGNVELPSHELERHLRETEQDISRLLEEETALAARLSEAQDTLPQLRNQHINLQSQRQQLLQHQEEATATFNEVQKRVDSFARSDLDARTDRILRNDTPEVLQLQKQLSELNQQIGILQQRRRNFLARIELANQRLSELQAEFAALNLKQMNLLLERDQVQTTRDALRARLEDFRYGALDNRQGRSLRDSTPEILQLERELRTAALDLTTLQQDFIALQQQQQDDQASLDETQGQRAEIREQQRQLETELESARVAYNEVVELEPTITYLTQVASVSAQILSKASVPIYPSNTSPLMVAILAGFVGGFMALVFVFIRAAVREPEEAKQEAPVRQAGKLKTSPS